MTHQTVDDLRADLASAGRPARPTWRVVQAAGWTFAGAATAAAAWAAVLAIYRAAPVLPPMNHLLAAALQDGPPAALGAQLAGVGGAIGLVFGMVAGLLFGGPGRVPAFLRWGVGWGAHALLAAGSGPLLAAATARWLPPLVGFGLACVALGGLAGLVVYTWGRPRVTAVPVEWPAEPAPAVGAVTPGALARVGPILVVSIACVVAVLVTPPSPAGRAVLAVGMVGLAVVWALAGQEARIRALERQLRDLAPPADLDSPRQ